MNMKKFLAIGVILLFIGLAFAPSIHANVSKEMVEFTTEVCGLDGGKQTVKLTQEEAEELDALFRSIRERLNKTESREEAEQVFKEAVVELDKYGLLGGLSVKQVQRILSLFNAIQRHKSISEMSENENYFCLISGAVTNAHFFGPISCLLSILATYLFFLDGYRYTRLLLFSWIIRASLYIHVINGFPVFPLRIGSVIILGDYWEFYKEWRTTSSEGWIKTFGLNGKKEWDGKFTGDLFSIDLSLLAGKQLYLVGADGFFGIKIYNLITRKTYLFGIARKVKID